MINISDNNMCYGCCACVNSCVKNAITIHDGISNFNSIVDEALCINCGKCLKVCPQNNKTMLVETKTFYQGWADSVLRKMGSSGGIATSIISMALKNEWYVCSCAFVDSTFKFVIKSDLEGIEIFSGSKYVKSYMGKVYSEILTLLLEGKKVLFIGLPCQVAAVKNYVSNNSMLYTVDLICHGTPSPKVLEAYLRDKKKTLSEIKKIKFRENNDFGLIVDDRKIVPKRVVDSYTNAFLSGIDYTDCCYSCRFATCERVGDLTLGDYWGGDESELKLGNSLILCQTEKGEEMLRKSKLNLKEADRKIAVDNNHQLSHPTPIHPKRDAFFSELKRGKGVNTAYYKANRKDAIKQSVKFGLSKIGVLK